MFTVENKNFFFDLFPAIFITTKHPKYSISPLVISQHEMYAACTTVVYIQLDAF
jgi:hypothetical protein